MAQAASEEKIHLYVSLQNDVPKHIGDESSRNSALKEFSHQHPNFKFFVLAQDTDFYNQTGIYAEQDTTRYEFQELLMAELFGESSNTGYYFPDDWKSDVSFVDRMIAICQDLLDVLFHQDPYLSSDECLVFIEIFHACLFLHLMVKTNADVVNLTCKDAIDRAMKTLSVFLSVAAIGQNEEMNTDLLTIQKTMTHGPAFMVKKQSLIVPRRQRVLSALSVLQDSPEVRGRMWDWLEGRQELFGLRRFEPLTVEHRLGQDFQSLGQ